MDFNQLIKLTETEAIKYFGHDKFIVRLYDGFDNQWCDASKEISWDEAKQSLLEKTENGTCRTKFSDIDYYTIYPSNTSMLYSNGFGENIR